MSDQLHHECGLALLRLLKPLSYYQKKYGSPFYALNKLYLLMEKQHNRGQDGAGLANIKFDVEPGTRYISRHRSNDRQAIQDIFSRIHARFEEVKRTNPEKLNDVYWLKRICRSAVNFGLDIFAMALMAVTALSNATLSCVRITG
jgi:amidophosphoribosyltransferase